MIEVEKKFHLDKADKERLISGAKFLGQKIHLDVYYDLPDYLLTRNYQWLRSRNGRFELKVGLVKELTQVTHYEELETEEEIRTHLQVPKKKSLKEYLREKGYTVFCIAKTIRNEYQKGEFIIDVDDVQYPGHEDFFYHLVEIELMVKHKSQMKEAEEKILVFAKENNLALAPTRGKIFEFLYQKAPKHFAALVKAGVARVDY